MKLHHFQTLSDKFLFSPLFSF